MHDTGRNNVPWVLRNIRFQLGGQMERETGRERMQPAKKEGRGGERGARRKA